MGTDGGEMEKERLAYSSGAGGRSRVSSVVAAVEVDGEGGADRCGGGRWPKEEPIASVAGGRRGGASRRGVRAG
ncbi:hypothetical protein QJS10_CPB21g01620 [Acorus calamus]|uniref:Uncharacterized protein n=1 Tax=Acorus calamus TaxID=4465 RepID=A0AAV9C7D4_ACOCL|nr:hypothetical protein QJS10_CPB21g01620 [Acorus calamus]